MAVQIFTSSGTWVCPAQITSVRVEAWGAGCDGQDSGGTIGGGGGAYARLNAFAVTPGKAYAVVVGQNAWPTAGDSSFDSTACVAQGAGLAGWPPTGGTVAGCTGDVKYAGGNGLQIAGGGGGGGGAGNAGAGGNATGTTGGAGGSVGGGKGGDAKAGGGENGGYIGGGGGNGILSSGGYGSFGQVKITYELQTVKVLVVGGGGHGGGTGGNTSGGGGGGGEVDYNATYSVAPGDVITVTVGAGSPQSSTNGQVGESSVFTSAFGATITALGGACGGTGAAGGNGACGGGGAGSNATARAGGTGTVHYNGGASFVDPDRPAGGGGGAGAVGATATGTAAGNGGAGLATTAINTTRYAGGGGGARTGADGVTDGAGADGGGDGVRNAIGEDAVANTGSGGGGGASSTTTTYFGGAGGSGIVIVRYLTSLFGSCVGGTKSTDGTDTLHTFTGTGTFTVDFATYCNVITYG